jgi:hypothetical protein
LWSRRSGVRVPSLTLREVPAKDGFSRPGLQRFGYGAVDRSNLLATQVRQEVSLDLRIGLGIIEKGVGVVRRDRKHISSDPVRFNLGTLSLDTGRAIMTTGVVVHTL